MYVPVYYTATLEEKKEHLVGPDKKSPIHLSTCRSGSTLGMGR